MKNRYSHEASSWSLGWSHGKEKLEGKPDTAKGSYYFNPTYDRPVDDEAIIDQYPSFVHPNIWPSESDCPGFVAACKDLGQAIVDVGLLLSRSCDAYVSSRLPKCEPNRLHNIIESSKCTKARLLYYFAVPPSSSSSASSSTASASSSAVIASSNDDAAHSPSSASAIIRDSTNSSSNGDEISSWCGWHNDHGSLTGLTSAMYFDAQGNEIPCPDPKAGLYIRSRCGNTFKVTVPSDCIAYQIGETSQIHSGGVLQATPHCVRAADAEGVSRGTLAVFMEPMWDCPMSTPPAADAPAAAPAEGGSREGGTAGSDTSIEVNVLRGARGELLPRGVPMLVNRWTGNSQTFGEFTEKTLASYY